MKIKYAVEKTEFEKWIDDINYSLDFIFSALSPEFREQLKNITDFRVYFEVEKIVCVEIYHKRYVEFKFDEVSAYTAAISFFGFAAQVYHEMCYKSVQN